MADRDVVAGPKTVPANRLAVLQTVLGFAGLALLSACASSGPHASPVAQADYYAAHAPGNYTPPGPPSDPWGPYIRLASERFNVPQPWIRQVMRVESGDHEYMDGHLTVSAAGAMGLMQLEPGTYQEMAGRYGLGQDPFNPYNNIMAGAAYIHEMYQIYGSPGFLAAYNAGPGRLDNYLDYHRPLPDETRNYVAMIGPHIEGIYPSQRSEGDMLAMNQLPVHIAPGLRPDVQMASTESLNARSLNNHASVAPSAIAQNTSVIPLPAPAMPAAPQPAPVQVAVLSPPPSFERPRYTPPAPVAAPPPRRRFALIRTAEAAAPPPRLEIASLNTGSDWAVQVGAYNSPAKARAALGIAELSSVHTLIHGQPVVDSVHTSHGLFYRARFVHLPHEAAISTCDRLSGNSTGCMVISPDAQS